MKIIKLYQTEDGRTFPTTLLAEAHEDLLEHVTRFISQLKAKPDSIEFDNGEGYIQHDPVTAEKLKVAFQEFSNLYLGKKVTFGILGRYLQDMDSPLYSVYCRFSCMDSLYREWGQPYFALNPDKGSQLEFTI